MRWPTIGRMTHSPLLIDVDTGYDDALALILALRTPGVRVLGITCAAGNHGLEQVGVNTLKVLDACNAPPIPVALGAAEALIERPRPPSLLHGRDGMADLGQPPSTRPLSPLHAVELMRETLLAATEPVTLVACAPLTNLALFARMYPRLLPRLGRVVIMGGTYVAQGNTSPLAEFNIRCDPEAARIVLTSGLPCELYPLDPFRQVTMTPDDARRLAASDLPAARMAGRICQYVIDWFKRDYVLIGDAGTMAYALDPAHADVRVLPVTVELTGGASRGMTVIDRRTEAQRASLNEWWTTSPHACKVVASVDAQHYAKVFLDALAQAPCVSV